MRKAKWIAIALFMAFVVNSCFPLCGCSPAEPDRMIDVVVKNSKGEDMLNPVTQGHFAINDIQLYYLENGNKVNVSTYNVAIHQGVEFDQNTFDGSLFRVSISSNYSSNGQAEALLEFKNIRTDTLAYTYSGLNMTEIKMNDKVVWNSDSKKFKTIEIIADR